MDILLGPLKLGSQTIVAAAVRDISDLKRGEQALREAHDQLETRVRQRTVELEQANKELEAFSYSVSHNLRAPLRHITGYAQIIEQDCRESVDDKTGAYLKIITESAGKMDLLIDQLLSLSRLGRQSIVRKPIDCERVVREVWDEMQQRGDTVGVEFELRSLPIAQGDPGLLRQVRTNLLENAAKYTAPKSVPQVLVDAVESEGNTWYRVIDNGVGFDPQYVDKLFSVFERLHHEDEFPGTGVGLATVRRIVHKHGGEVRASGSVGQGARFEFTLGA